MRVSIKNSTAISTLSTSFSDIKTRVNYHRMVLGDLGLGLGLVGVTIQTLQTSTNDNSTTINTLATSSSDIKTRVNDHKKALGDLGLGLWLVGVTVQMLQTSLDALDPNIEGQLQTLNETVSVNSTDISSLDTNVNGQIQTLKAIVSGNSTAISTLAYTSSAMGNDIETRFNYYKNALGDLGLGLWLVGVIV